MSSRVSRCLDTLNDSCDGSTYKVTLKPQSRAQLLEAGVGGLGEGDWELAGHRDGGVQVERTSRAEVKMHELVPFIQRQVRNWVGLEPRLPGRSGKK